MIIQLQADFKQTAGSPAEFVSEFKGIKGAFPKDLEMMELCI